MESTRHVLTSYGGGDVCLEGSFDLERAIHRVAEVAEDLTLAQIMQSSVNIVRLELERQDAEVSVSVFHPLIAKVTQEITSVAESYKSGEAVLWWKEDDQKAYIARRIPVYLAAQSNGDTENTEEEARETLSLQLVNRLIAMAQSTVESLKKEMTIQECKTSRGSVIEET